MITPIVILSLALITLAAIYYRERKRLLGEVATEKRRVSDTNAEWQVRYDAAVTATFTHLLEKMTELAAYTFAAEIDTNACTKCGRAYLAHRESLKDDLHDLFAKVAEVQSAGVQAMLNDLREKVAVMNAATQDATRQTLAAAAEVSNVRAENTIHRTLLERALMLPRDVSDGERMIFLTRARAALDSARATSEWPTEQFWLDYVKLHSTKMDVR